MGRVLTLLYHRVNCLENDLNLLAVNPDNFYEHMVYLQQNYKIVKFDEEWDDVDNEAVCVTFDDGYFDNYLFAVPILEELKIPATIFISTGNLNTKKEYWWDELERNLLLENWHYDQIFELKDDIFSCKWEMSTHEARTELYNTLHWLMQKNINVAKRENWMQQLRNWSKLDPNGREENYSLQLNKMDGFPSELITIGAHTVNHPSLSRLSEEEQRFEIVTSKNTLERIFERKIKVFSYPFGTVHDYNENTIDICRTCGFEKAAANYSGVWDSKCDKFQIPRYIIRDWNLSNFKDKIQSFWR